VLIADRQIEAKARQDAHRQAEAKRRASKLGRR
jgi:hypothetical protein